MLAHTLPYLTFAATHLFSGVSAAAIGTLPNYDEHDLGSGTGVNKRDHAEPSQDDNTPSPPDEITPDEAARFASAIPDDILDDSIEAAQNWLEEHLPELRKRDLDDLSNSPEDGLTLDEAAKFASAFPNDILDDGFDAARNWLKKHHQEPAARHATAELERRDSVTVAACVGSILWFLSLNLLPMAKGASLILKVEKFRRLVNELGGARKTASLLMNNLTKPRGRHQVPGMTIKQKIKKLRNVISTIGQELLSSSGIVKYCFDAS